MFYGDGEDTSVFLGRFGLVLYYEYIIIRIGFVFRVVCGLVVMVLSGVGKVVGFWILFSFIESEYFNKIFSDFIRIYRMFEKFWVR